MLVSYNLLIIRMRVRWNLNNDDLGNSVVSPPGQSSCEDVTREQKQGIPQSGKKSQEGSPSSLIKVLPLFFLHKFWDAWKISELQLHCWLFLKKSQFNKLHLVYLYTTSLQQLWAAYNNNNKRIQNIHMENCRLFALSGLLPLFFFFKPTFCTTVNRLAFRQGVKIYLLMELHFKATWSLFASRMETVKKRGISICIYHSAPAAVSKASTNHVFQL